MYRKYLYHGDHRCAREFFMALPNSQLNSLIFPEIRFFEAETFSDAIKSQKLWRRSNAAFISLRIIPALPGAVTV
jgi:hypothetical protein